MIEAVILAGGAGSRLQPARRGQKVMAPVGGRPFLERTIALACGFGIRRIVLALGHQAAEVTAWLEAGGAPDIDLVPSIETRPLGTGGALRLALPLLRAPRVLVLNGDSWLALDPAAVAACHARRRAAVTMCLAWAADCGRFGRVELAADGAVGSVSEKAAGGSGWINAGVYLFEREAVAEIDPDRPVSLEREVLPGRCSRGLFGYLQPAPFVDIGTEEGWRAAEALFAAGDGGRSRP